MSAVGDRAAALRQALGDGWDPEGSLPPLSRDGERPVADPPAPTPGVVPTAAAVWAALEEVPDPEIPVISVVELGIVRGVELDGARVTVLITPTYSGCPAMAAIEHDVRTALAARGWTDAHVRTVHTPAWTTDWMSDAARAKLRAYGIAPPGPRPADDERLVPLRRAGRPDPAVSCPFCGSGDTVLESRFGATACKALHVCRACRQPFEAFKAI